MGISGLLPLLKSIQKPCNLKKFAGLTIGVDAYGWLHRGTVACATDLALDKPTTKFVDFAMHRVRMLIYFGVIPYLVFDGDYLPSKASTEIERAKRRADSRKVGLELYRLGKSSQAHSELQKAIDVTPEMARQLIEELKRYNVKYVVAPYEADAQLVYLERNGMIQGILSEDSDLLVFGAKRLLTKLDQYGDCIEINRGDFTTCADINLVGWSDAEFRLMTILSGCDYLANINQLGLKNAYRLVRKYKTIEKIVRILQFEGKYRVPQGYLEDVRKAEMTFLHQRVFNPKESRLVMATDLDEELRPDYFDFIGKDVEPAIAAGVANGDLHPMTKEPILLESQKAPSSLATPKQRPNVKCDLKPTMSIEAFFKRQAKRSPLAELDPNSFTPSPSQNRLLEQRSTTWTSTSVARSSPCFRSGAFSQTLSKVTKTPRTGQDQAHKDNLSLLHHPPKRQRFCDDINKSSDTAAVKFKEKLHRSKFFAPVDQRLIEKPKCAAKSTNVSIWSDDSIEDAMAALPDTVGEDNKKTAAEFSIYTDEQFQPDELPPLLSYGTEGFYGLCDETGRSPALSPVDSRSLGKNTDSCISEELKTIAKFYMQKPGSIKIVKPLEEESLVDIAQLPTQVQNGSETAPLLHSKRLLSSSKCYVHPLEMESVRTPETDLALVSQAAENNVSNIESKAKLVPVSALTRRPLLGSEETLMPDSEDENKGLFLAELETKKSKIDLSRFAFIA